MSRARLGLALGAGAARGWAHLGVLQALSEMDIEPDIVCGTSIGALVGGFYVGGNIGDLQRWACGLSKLRMIRYMGLSLNGKSIIGGSKLFAEMDPFLGDLKIENLARPFGCVATDLTTGNEVWLTKGQLAEAIRASFAIPGVFEPVMFDARWLVDGAIVNPVPVSVCRGLGAEKVIAVRLETYGTRAGAGPDRRVGGAALLGVRRCRRLRGVGTRRQPARRLAARRRGAPARHRRGPRQHAGHRHGRWWAWAGVPPGRGAPAE